MLLGVGEVFHLLSVIIRKNKKQYAVIFEEAKTSQRKNSKEKTVKQRDTTDQATFDIPFLVEKEE